VAPSPPSKLTVQIPSALGFNASVSDFRVFVDGRFVGNYTPDGATLELPAGMRRVVVELPSAYQRRELPNGSAEIRTFSLRGEERIEILGGASQQTLVFNSDNLKSREVEDDSGH
jgi:hypothetical protein